MNRLLRVLDDVDRVRARLDYGDEPVDQRELYELFGRVKYEAEQVLELLAAVQSPETLKIVPRDDEDGSFFYERAHEVTVTFTIVDLEPLLRLVAPGAFEEVDQVQRELDAAYRREGEVRERVAQLEADLAEARVPRPVDLTEAVELREHVQVKPGRDTVIEDCGNSGCCAPYEDQGQPTERETDR